ncbi:MAG: glycosyltransferase family 4 protein [Dehalococcoidia bacterium]
MNPTAERPRILFLGTTYAGHATRFDNLERNTACDERIDARYRRVTGWREGGLVERLPLLSRAVKGRMRSVIEAAPVAAVPRPDAVWTSVSEVLAPHLWALTGPMRRPVLYDLDWTLDQQEAWARLYFRRRMKRGLRLAVARASERAFYSRVTLFTPWSAWAADGLRAAGVDDGRILELPPGVDLDQWRPRTELREGTSERLPRLLFVGGDFRRKGGDLVVEAVQTVLRGRCELDIVTRDPAVRPGPGVRVHAAEPNSPLLRELYARADLFVMPSRAECFGIATIEAMASGLPVLVGDVGGGRSIVDHGETGWLVSPVREAVFAALEEALSDMPRLQAMGAAARRVAERRFDGRANDARIVDLLVEMARAGTAFRLRQGALA